MWKKILSVLAVIFGGFFFYLFKQYISSKVNQALDKNTKEQKAMEENYSKTIKEEDKKIGIEFEKNRNKPVTKYSELNLK